MESENRSDVEQEPGRGSDRESSVPVDRRTLLRAASTGALASAVAVAGCSTQSERHEAEPVGLAPEAGDAGYSRSSMNSSSVTREVDAEEATIEVTLVSRLASYDHEGSNFVDSATVGLASTPAVSKAGTSLNPMTHLPLRDLLNGDVDTVFTEQVGLGTGWQRGPEELATRKGTLLGSSVEFRTFAGVTDEDEFTLVNLARVEDGDDAVLVGDARTKPAQTGNNPFLGQDGYVTQEVLEEVQAMFVDLLEFVVHGDEVQTPTGTETSGETGGLQTTMLPEKPRAGLAEPRAEGIPLSEVPTQFHRIAARHVEESMGTLVAPEWDQARLTGPVYPLYRPDVDGPAFYEFGVEPGGFVVVATADHDHPVPHWNYRGGRLTQQLAGQARANDADEPVRFYKIDAKYYVGENADGERVAELGNRVLAIDDPDDVLTVERLDETLGDTEEMLPEHLLEMDGPTLSEIGTGPTEDVDSDDGISEDDEQAILRREGPQEMPVEYVEWESWDALKSGFEDSYGVLAEADRRLSRPAWNVEDALEENGRGLIEGTPVLEPLLFDDDASYNFDGPGAELVSVERVDREGAADALQIVARETPDEDTTLEVTFEYGNGVTETRRFLLSPEFESGAAGLGAFSFDGGLDGMASSDGSGLATALGGGGWDIWWAGGAGDQCEYFQFDYQNCPVGCGPVAWAMLFGWADRKAENSGSQWAPRWGLFRENGGKGANAKAPTNLNSGNGVADVIRELNEDCKTFCFGGGGATSPNDMPLAYKYFWGRTGTYLHAWWNGGFTPGIPTGKLLKKSRQSIIHRNTPAILGTGWAPAHYPLAWGYGYKKTVVKKKAFGITYYKNVKHHHSFYENKGWNDCCEGWNNGKTWFAGRIWPHRPDWA